MIAVATALLIMMPVAALATTEEHRGWAATRGSEGIGRDSDLSEARSLSVGLSSGRVRFALESSGSASLAILPEIMAFEIDDGYSTMRHGNPSYCSQKP